MKITINVPDDYKFESTVNEIVYQWSPADMSNAALLYLVEYGAQRVVNDRCGGKDKSPEDKAKIANGIVARLTSADFAERVSRAKPDELGPLGRFIRDIVRDKLREAGGKAWATYKAIKGDDATERRNDFLNTVYKRQADAKRDAIDSLADKAKAKYEAEQKAKAKAVASLDSLDVEI